MVSDVSCSGAADTLGALGGGVSTSSLANCSARSAVDGNAGNDGGRRDGLVGAPGALGLLMLVLVLLRAGVLVNSGKG